MDRNARVRKAISKAINRRAPVERVMEGQAVATGQLLPEGFFGCGPRLKPEPYRHVSAERNRAEA